jgi:glycosyltransferase involved in cell wall biosynthesis
VLRRADLVVAICQGIRTEVVGRGVDPRRVIVVPNGVEAEWFEGRPPARDLAARLGLGGGPVFGYVGSFSHYEGLPFLIGAMAEVVARLPEATLVLAGGGRDDDAVREAARRAGPAVKLLGRIPHDQVRDLYSLLTVLVLPRRRMRLTELVTPLKPLEAMAVGVPVLASDVGGHTELIADGQTGLLFKAESQNSLVEQATRLASDGQLRAELAANARRWVREQRTWDHIVAAYPTAYGGSA